MLIKIQNDKNECFVKTVALDGERNLKPKVQCKQVAKNFEKIFDTKKNASKSVLKLSAIKPIKELYSWQGKIEVEIDGEETSHKVDNNSFLHRGSFLENSGSVVGLVVYTGTETKLMMNLGKYKFKQSQFEKVLNGILCFNLACAIILAIINVLLYRDFTR